MLGLDQQIRQLKYKLCQIRGLVTTPVRLQIIVDVSLYPDASIILPSGVKEFVIRDIQKNPVRNIKSDSVEVYLDSSVSPLPRELTDRKSYNVTYTVERTIITFLSETQFEQLYIIRYEYPSLTT